MAIFNSYVSLPEGIYHNPMSRLSIPTHGEDIDLSEHSKTMGILRWNSLVSP
jgi:hypothetical protein